MMNPRHSRSLADLAVWLLATPVAFYLRLDADVLRHTQGMVVLLAGSVPLKLFALWYFNLPRQSWRKVGVHDLLALVRAVALVTVIMTAGAVLLQTRGMVVPRSAPLIEGMFALLCLSGMRLVARLMHEYKRTIAVDGEARNILIVGAGEAGTMMARELLRHPESKLRPVGFVDDAPEKARQKFLGLQVYGRIDDIPKVCLENDIDELLICLPSVSGEIVRRVVTQAKRADVRHRIIPGIYDLLSGKVSMSQIREVEVEDLLRRDPVRLFDDEIAGFLRGRQILVTGAGGSIGSEIVRQVARFEPAGLILLGRGENSIYHIAREMRSKWPNVPIEAVIADVCDRNRIAAIFERVQPDVVFHAAAHKHVSLMEENPEEAIKNNVGGTLSVVEAALAGSVMRFVNISTDKAVNPTSIMGASKRIAEYVVGHTARQAAQEDRVFVSVRFGNVLGSRGSVIPLFKEQIAEGGPITITHPEMQRYFMTIPESAQLVLQAGAFQENDRVYVLDMGEPVRIVDLARDLVALSGLDPDRDIEIKVIGKRRGEKLSEELFGNEDGLMPSSHAKILVARKSLPQESAFETQLRALLDAARQADIGRMQDVLGQIIPEFPRTREQTSESMN